MYVRTHTHTFIHITGKLYAFRGPVDDEFRWPGQQVPPGTLNASAYVDLFRRLDISTVIQLNEPQYDRCRARSGCCLPTCNAMVLCGAAWCTWCSTPVVLGLTLANAMMLRDLACCHMVLVTDAYPT